MLPLLRRGRGRYAAALALLLPLALLAAGCGGSGDGGGGSGAVKVVATTTVVGDLAREVGGGDVEVTQLLQPNSDPHDYEPRPRDVLETAKASIVLASGDGLDGWIANVAEQAGGGAKLVDVGATLPTREQPAGVDAHGSGGADAQAHDHDAHGGDAHALDDGHDHGSIDPHWWHDPTNVEAAALTVRDVLTQADPAGRARYAANAAAYVRKLRTLDAGIRRCIDSVPPARRKLVTDHEALGWFAARYGIDVVGAVIPSLSTQAQPSAGDIAELARVIRREHVTAVFPQSGTSGKLPRAVAKETGATAQYTLYADSLGPEGSDAATYLGMEAHNADAMVRGFTGGARGCEIPGL